MYRPFKKFRITYEDESTEVVNLPTKSMVYAYLRKMKVMNCVFSHVHKRFTKVESL